MKEVMLNNYTSNKINENVIYKNRRYTLDLVEISCMLAYFHCKIIALLNLNFLYETKSER